MSQSDPSPDPKQSDGGIKDSHSFPWRLGIYDSHCHPTDIMTSTECIPDMKARVLTVMSTRSQDQALVEQIAGKYFFGARGDASDIGDSPDTSKGLIVPAFGWHPWFSHLIFDDRGNAGCDVATIDAVEHYKNVLTPPPDDERFLASLHQPKSLSKFLQETEQRLLKFPLALVGEIGLDKAFRLPEGPSVMTGDVSMKTGGDDGSYTPGSREGRPLTAYRVRMEHQKTVLRAQLELAAKHRRAVSVHSVQAHGVVFELLQGLWKGHERPSKRELKKQKKDALGAIEDDKSVGNQTKNSPFPPRICMHSYSGPPDALRQFLDPKVPAEIFFSFSECINFSSPAASKAVEVIKAMPEDRILIESDLHCAGERMDELLEGIVRRVCEVKGWTLERGATVLRRNWEKFIFGE